MDVHTTMNGWVQNWVQVEIFVTTQQNWNIIWYIYAVSLSLHNVSFKKY